MGTLDLTTPVAAHVSICDLEYGIIALLDSYDHTKLRSDTGLS
jgi:hypothetical protein